MCCVVDKLTFVNAELFIWNMGSLMMNGKLEVLCDWLVDVDTQIMLKSKFLIKRFVENVYMEFN